MTPKEKAEELVDNYDFLQAVIEGFSFYDAKQCALLAVNEILNAIKIELGVDLSTTDVVNFASNKIIYWTEVKQEIEKL